MASLFATESNMSALDTKHLASKSSQSPVRQGKLVYNSSLN